MVHFGVAAPRLDGRPGDCGPGAYATRLLHIAAPRLARVVHNVEQEKGQNDFDKPRCITMPSSGENRPHPLRLLMTP